LSIISRRSTASKFTYRKSRWMFEYACS